MNNFIDHILTFSSQGDADDVFQVPLDTARGPMSLVSANVYLSAVGGSPTAVTLDVDLTDGTNTRNAIAAGSIGTGAGATRLVPADADLEDGDHIADQEESTSYWRAEVDFNFTGGSSPTVTGTLVLRWAV
jgi:hypothetical protein